MRAMAKAQPRQLEISIDPGITGTGLAVWDTDFPPEKGLLRCVNLYPSSKREWTVRAEMLLFALGFELSRYQNDPVKFAELTHAYIEFPEFRTDEVGYASAAEGSLFKLSFLVGGMVHLLSSMDICYTLVKPSAWKGSLPKRVVEKRIRRILPEAVVERCKPTSHGWDAIGLYLAQKGLL